MRNIVGDVLTKLAKENGYQNKTELLNDYGFLPTIFVPRHKKIGIVMLLIKSIKHNKKKS